MGHGKGAEVEQPCALDELSIHLIRRKEHVRTGVSIEGKIPVPVLKGLYEGQRGSGILIHNQVGGVDSHLFQNGLQLQPEDVLPHLSDEGRGMAELIQHGQHVAGRAAGIRLKHGISLRAHSVVRKINQQFSKCYDIEFFHDYLYSAARAAFI